MITDNFRGWLKSALIRGVWTIAETALATIGTTATIMSDVNWKIVLSSSLLAGIISILKSVITGLPEVN